MARPRSFDTAEIVLAARQVFWEKGYRGAAIEDLERNTGLNRSSLYATFGSKKALFLRALALYLDDFIGPRLAPMERADADVGDIESFFAGLARLFRSGDPAARRGCLMVNSIAELEGRVPLLKSRSAGFRDRLRSAFANALSRGTRGDRVEERARLLTSATLGAWLATRIAPTEAARMCEAWIAELRDWRA